MATQSFGRRFNEFLAFLARNERKLGAVLFAFGFLTDLLTFGLLPIEIVNWFFVSYLVLAAVTTFGTHLISTFRARDVWWKKTLAVLFPLGAQYAFGGLFSGFVVFYARSSVFAVSWPFLLLLLLVYVGNEYFRTHKEHIVFQTVLFFFALYAYAIFALPFFIGSINQWVFLGSTALALAVFAAFMGILYQINKKRLGEFIRPIGGSVLAVTIAMCISYVTGLIPPIPLALAHEGVYHSVTKIDGGYQVEAEESEPWWYLGAERVQQVPGQPLYVMSAVRAPIRFSSTIVHRWEHYESETGKWVTANRISFPTTGGRVEGYRGYSAKENLEEGKWRVSVETPSGQTIGRIRFDVERVDTPPALIVETF